MITLVVGLPWLPIVVHFFNYVSVLSSVPELSFIFLRIGSVPDPLSFLADSVVSDFFFGVCCGDECMVGDIIPVIAFFIYEIVLSFGGNCRQISRHSVQVLILGLFQGIPPVDFSARVSVVMTVAFIGERVACRRRSHGLGSFFLQ